MSYTTISPVCTCGTNIGHVYAAYNISKTKKIKAYLTKTGYNESDTSVIKNITMREFLDKVHITNICCRTMMIGHNSIIQGTI